MSENNFSVWIGNGGTLTNPNKKVFIGSEKDCENFISELVNKKRKRVIQIFYHLNNGMKVKSRLFYAFISKNNI